MLNNRKKYIVLRSAHTRHTSIKSNYIGLNLLLPLRLFSTTSIRKGDPLSFVASAFNTAYAASHIANPLGAAFVLLMGMVSTLFFVTLSLPTFFGLDPVLVTQRVESILLLYDTFLAYEQSGIDMLLANMNNFSPEILRNFYLSLQELVTVRESLFPIIADLINSPQMEYIDGPLADRVNQMFENFRAQGNNLMGLIRNLEDRLNIAQEERIPSFWFEG